MTDDAWKSHVVRQGEYLTKLAHQLGFDADAVWNHTRNADLRALRTNREILCPGDVLWVPDSPRKLVQLRIGEDNAFASSIPETQIHLTLLQRDGTPLANTAYTVQGAPGLTDGSTDGDGKVSLTLPVHVERVLLVFESGQQYQVAVGEMDPIEETSGVLKRLIHLGYLTECADPTSDDFELRLALSAFQKAQGLPITGQIDDPTRHALVAAHKS